MYLNKKKFAGNLLIILEMILGSCLMILSFLFSVWPTSGELLNKSGNSDTFWIIIAMKRLLIITFSVILYGWILHKGNLVWIQKTGWGSRRNSAIFTVGSSILVFLSALVGLIIFMLQKPVA
jgi:hypothetical protein